MAKPRRKHPGFNIVEGSPQGETFLSILMSFLGAEVWWKPVHQTRDKSIVFLIGGSRGRGVLVEAAERAEDDCWVHQWGFRYEPADLGVVVQMDLLAYRWDPWLHAQITGDRSLLDGSPSRRRSEQEQRDWEIGSERDQYRMTVLPKEASQSNLCGIPLEEIEAILDRHAVEESHNAQEVGMIRPAGADDPYGGLLGGDFPLVD